MSHLENTLMNIYRQLSRIENQKNSDVFEEFKYSVETIFPHQLSQLEECVDIVVSDGTVDREKLSKLIVTFYQLSLTFEELKDNMVTIGELLNE